MVLLKGGVFNLKFTFTPGWFSVVVNKGNDPLLKTEIRHGRHELMPEVEKAEEIMGLAEESKEIKCMVQSSRGKRYTAAPR